MTSVLGVLGALSMIASVAFGTVLAIAEGYDKRHARVPKAKLPKPEEGLEISSDLEWTERMKVLARVGFRGGLVLAWCSALIAVT